jgi:hypothetical protein
VNRSYTILKDSKASEPVVAPFRCISLVIRAPAMTHMSRWLEHWASDDKFAHASSTAESSPEANRGNSLSDERAIGEIIRFSNDEKSNNYEKMCASSTMSTQQQLIPDIQISNPNQNRFTNLLSINSAIERVPSPQTKTTQKPAVVGTGLYLPLRLRSSTPIPSRGIPRLSLKSRL